MILPQDEKWMRRALDLARRAEGCTRPNPPVGAVVVHAGIEVGAGYHRVAGGPHAEVYALLKAGARANGATLYVTLEPCSTFGRTPPCTDMILRSGISEVVVALRDPNPLHHGRGLAILRRHGIHVKVGVCAEDARQLIAPFTKWVTTGLPYVTLKLGMTLDGRIADSKGCSKWITSSISRSVVRNLRSKVDAILVGARTACVDDPSLLPSRRRRVPLFRIVVDSRGRVSPNAKLFSDGFAHNTIVATTEACSSTRRRSYEASGAQVLVLPGTPGRVSLTALVKRLGAMGLLHVMCEGGAELAAGLVRAGLVDELLFFVAPRLLGGRNSLPAITGKGWPLDQGPWFRFVQSQRSGRDILLRAVPVSPPKNKHKSSNSCSLV